MDNINNLDPRTLRAKEQYEGKEFYCEDGVHKFIIEKFNSAHDIDILFPESGVRQKKQVDQIRKGKVRYPFLNRNGKLSPIYFEDPLSAIIGINYKTNQGYHIKIIDAKSFGEVTYQFQDQFGYIGTTTIQNIRKGEVRNPYHMNEFGGYLGEGPYTGNKPLYNIWHSLLVRGSGARAMKYDKLYTKGAQYLNCKVCDEWRNYNKFAHWYTLKASQLNQSIYYEVDKDLLYPMYRSSTEGYKLYSPVTCVLLPRELNLMLVNVVGCSNAWERNDTISEDKRKCIIEATEHYRSINALSDKAYQAIKSLYYNDGTPLSYVNFRGGINYYENAFNLE